MGAGSRGWNGVAASSEPHPLPVLGLGLVSRLSNGSRPAPRRVLVLTVTISEPKRAKPVVGRKGFKQFALFTIISTHNPARSSGLLGYRW